MRQTAMLFIALSALTLAGSVSPLAAKRVSAIPRPDKALWAGHQVVFGQTKVPFRGTLRTRTDTFVLAKVTKNEHQVFIEQMACDTIIQDVAGVSVKIPSAAFKKMPPVRFRLLCDNQSLSSKPWTVGWRLQDVDRDGFPGMSVEVDAPLCDGQLHVANQTTSQAQGKLTSRGMQGSISVLVRQQILGADSLCLRLFAKDSEERQHGRFAYQEVSHSATCESLLREGWPIRADNYRVSTLRERGN